MRHILIAAEPTAKHHCRASMIRTTLQSALCLVLSPLLVAQQATSGGQNQVAQAKAATIALRKGTYVPLVFLETVSSSTAQKGQSVRLVVKDNVIVSGTVAIPRGTPVTGVVTCVRKAIPGQRNGSLWVQPVSLTLPDGSPLSLREAPDGDGMANGLTGVMFTVAALPFWIADMVKAPFERHKPVEPGNDEVFPACSDSWSASTTKTVIKSVVSNQGRASQPPVDIDAICPARTRPKPSSDPAIPQEQTSPHADTAPDLH
ncbi:MAG: hypothetical protein WCA10_12980 [Terracidiphilus sp.]